MPPSNQRSTPHDNVRQAIVNCSVRTVPRECWGKLKPRYEELEADWKYTTIVIHHSGNRLSPTPEAVEKLHMVEHCWPDVGYHFLVGKSGEIYEGRQLAYKGSHVAGQNTGKIGICLLGDFDRAVFDFGSDALTQKQKASTLLLARTLIKHFPLTTLGGHEEFTAGMKSFLVETFVKSCPGRPGGMNIVASLRDELKLAAP